MTAKEILSNIIHDFDPESFKAFFRQKNTDFAPISQSLEHYQDKDFTNFYQIGEINFHEASQRLVVITIKILLPLSERSGKKAQYEKAKKILRELNIFDAGIFVFYDQNKNFRFSLIYAESLGTRRQFSNFKRFTYFVSQELTNNTFLNRIGDVDFSTLEDIKEAFSLEPVNKEFFSTVAMLFTKLAGGERRIGKEDFKGKGLLHLPSTVDDTLKKEFSIRLIGRLVFCWFLKKKHSEAGVSLLPDELLSSASVRKTPNYYHSILEPLFFETLNKPAEERKKRFQSDSWVKVPFLNGGLFTPDDHDFYQVNALDTSMFVNVLKVPDTWIKDLCEVFESYNFTIDENTSVDVEISIDPEMLGRIFENLLAEINPETGETARKSTGSYYTPRPIVEYMVDESLKQYLLNKTKVSEDKISQLLSYGDEEITLSESDKDAVLDALDAIKIIDPACGSGAFPMGILHKMLLILQRIDPDSQKWIDKKLSQIESVTVRKELGKKLRKENWNYVHKLGIIQSSIYGVDIQPVATEISRLRFFLSLIVDEKVEDNEPNRGVDPLPNLEFKFVCANSLIPLAEEGGELFDNKEMAQQMQDIRDRYFKTDNARIKDKMKKDFDVILKKGYSLFASQKQKQLLTYRPFDTNNICSFFDSKFMFGVDGFDIVIANPPYLKERDNKNEFEQVNNSSFGKKYHQGKMDFWFYFLHKAIDIVKADGVISYITSRYWLNSSGAKKLIKRVIAELSFVNFIDIGKIKVFDAVAGQHMVATYKKSKAIDDFVYKKLENVVSDISRNNNTDNVVIKHLSNKEVFSTNDEIILEASQFKHQDLLELWEVCDSSVGVQESPDKVSNKQIKKNKKVNDIYAGDGIFVLNKLELEKVRPNNIEKTVIKKYLDPNDLFRYGLNWSEKYLIYSDKDTKEQIKKDNHFINLKKHLDKYKDFITSSNKPYGLHRARDLKYFVSPKIIFKGMFVENEFAYDDQDYFVGFSFSLIIQKDKQYSLKYILAILNSKFALDWFYKNGKKRGAGVDIGVEKLRLFPIKIADALTQKTFIEMIDKILAFTKSGDFLQNTSKQTKVKEYERQIDQMVYELYGLTEEEIKVVENS